MQTYLPPSASFLKPEDDADDEHEEYDPADDCGLYPGGGCMLAGTEHCDFECPFR